MNKIIKIEPVEDCLRINWIPHIKCNYDCMYCPENRHSDKNDLLDLQQLQDYWIKIYEKTKHRNLQYKLGFSGGEMIINRDFLPFVQWLNINYRPSIGTIAVSTNGSGSKNYYLKMFEHVDMMAFSTHTEFIDDDRFWDIVVACNKFAKGNHKNFMVNIMDEFWAQDRIDGYVKFCQENEISYSRKFIDYGFQSRPMPIFKNVPTHT